MTKQADNIVYDSYNKKWWDLSGFFKVLEKYYEGDPEIMSEQLLKAIELMMHSEQDNIIDPMIKASTLNLLTIREAVHEMKINQTL